MRFVNQSREPAIRQLQLMTEKKNGMDKYGTLLLMRENMTSVILIPVCELLVCRTLNVSACRGIRIICSVTFGTSATLKICKPTGDVGQRSKKLRLTRQKLRLRLQPPRVLQHLQVMVLVRTPLSAQAKFLPR